MVVDSILVVGKTLQLPSSLMNMVRTLGDRSNQSYSFLVRYIIDALLTTGDMANALLESKSLAFSLKEYPAGEDLIQVFYSTLSSGKFRDESMAAAESFMTAWSSITGYAGIVQRLTYPLRWLSTTAHKLVLRVPLVIGMNRTQPGSFGNFMAAFSPLDPPFARTRCGYLALVPPSTRTGDSVALLAGGRFPYVIRDKGSKWELVGSSYVHGIVNGEAWRENQCHELQFA
jgi:hypothetical protein